MNHFVEPSEPDFETRLFDEAQKIVTGKSDTHGKPERNFQNIAEYWTVYLRIEGLIDEDQCIEDHDVAELMDLLKHARSQTGEYNEDDYRDRLNYTNFAANYRNE